MSTRSPRNGTPSASSSARWRAPLASEPSARTIRYHGTVGSSQSRQHGAGEARRARRDVAVGAHEALRGVADAAPGRARRASSSRVSSRAMRHGTYSIVARDPDDRRARRRRCSRTGSPSARCAPGRAPGVGAVATQSVVEPAHGPNALDRLGGGESARSRRSAGCSPPTRWRAVRQVGGRRRARRRRRPHRRRTASRTPAT